MPKHSHGSGSIYKRGKIWWLSYYANGEHICESSHSHDKSAAKQMLQRRLGQVAEGRYVGPRVDRVTFDELAEDMLNDYRINGKKSLKDAQRTVKALARFFAGRRFNLYCLQRFRGTWLRDKRLGSQMAPSTGNWLD